VEIAAILGANASSSGLLRASRPFAAGDKGLANLCRRILNRPSRRKLGNILLAEGYFYPMMSRFFSRYSSRLISPRA